MRAVDLTAARRLAVLRQRLAGPRPGRGPAGILRVIRELGYVQLDPTNVVARSHLLVLGARLGRFDPAHLQRLLRERRLFEYAAFILPTDDLPLHLRRMAAYRRPRTAWARRVAAWVETNDALRRHVLMRLRRDGPLPTSAFEDLASAPWRSRGWTSGKNVSQMLEFLWRQGRITVAAREGGERWWILSERWLPAARSLPEREAERRGTERAVRSLGIATAAQLRSSYAFARFVTRRAIADLARDGTFEAVRIAEVSGPGAAVWYVHAEDLATMERIGREWEPRTTLLSPFDNLIIDRSRTERLFGSATGWSSTSRPCSAGSDTSPCPSCTASGSSARSIRGWIGRPGVSW